MLCIGKFRFNKFSISMKLIRVLCRIDLILD